MKFNKFFYVVVLVVVLMVACVSALPVTYSGDLVINGAPGVNTELTIRTTYGNYSGTFNDTYVLNVLEDEGSVIDFYIGTELYSSPVQPSMASLVDETIYWPQQPDGGACTVDEQCVNNVCCGSSSATNYNQCGTCSYPTPPPSDPSGGSSGGGGGGAYVPPTTTDEEVVVNETVEDVSSQEEDVGDGSSASTNEEDSSDEELVIDQEEDSGLSWYEEAWLWLKDYFVTQFDNTVWLINTFGSLALLLLLFYYRRNNDESEE